MIDLPYWRLRLATQAHSGSPHVGLMCDQFAEILDEVEAERERVTQLEQAAAALREQIEKAERLRGNACLAVVIAQERIAELEQRIAALLGAGQ